MAEPIRQPIFFVVDEDPSAVEALAGDLERRFDADYRVVGETSVPAALERLGALHDAGDQVALIICYESMRAMPGSELLARSRTIYPDAKRILLIDYGDQRMLDVIARGMALGHVEHYLTKPWRPRQHLLYPVVGEALVAWTRANWPGFELVRLVGDHWDPASHQLRDALERNNVPYGFYDRDSPEGAGLLQQLDEVPDNPVVFLPDGRVLTSYTQADIAEAVGAQVRPKLDAYDLVVVGAGPAGLSAAVYGASEGLSSLVLESLAMGGQAGISSRIRNFLGFPRASAAASWPNGRFSRPGCSGRNLSSLTAQPGCPPRQTGWWSRWPMAARWPPVRSCWPPASATGSWTRLASLTLSAPGCSTARRCPRHPRSRTRTCSSPAPGTPPGRRPSTFPDRPAASPLLVRGDTLAKSMSDYLVKEIDATSRVRVRLQTEVAAARGDRRLTGLVLRDRRTGRHERVPAAALFVMIGATPHTGWLPAAFRRDRHGFILTGRDLPSQEPAGAGRPVPLPLETSLPGVFAAGDVRAGSVKRVASAVGEGSVAVPQVHQHLQRHTRQAAS